MKGTDALKKWREQATPLTAEELAHKKRKLTPMKALRLKCLDCVGYSPKDVADCDIVDCPLYPYRLGHRPKKQVIYTFDKRKNGCDKVQIER